MSHLSNRIGRPTYDSTVINQKEDSFSSPGNIPENSITLSEMLSARNSPIKTNAKSQVSTVRRNPRYQPLASKELYNTQSSVISKQSKDKQSQLLTTVSFEQKVIEANLKVNNIEYQELVIKQKQVQLQLIHEQGIQRKLRGKINKAKSVIKQTRECVWKQSTELERRKQDLEDYYAYLEDKLQNSTRVPQSCQQKLKKLERILEQRAIAPEETLMRQISELRTVGDQFKQKHLSLIQEKERILTGIKGINKQKQQRKQSIEHDQREVHQQQKLRQRYQDALRYRKLLGEQQKLSRQMKEEKQKLNRQMKEEQETLDKLNSVHQQHRKYALTIQEGLRKQFRLSQRERNYKRSVKLENSIKLSETISTLTQLQRRKQALQTQLQQRNKDLQGLQMVVNLLIVTYSALQGQLLSKKS